MTEFFNAHHPATAFDHDSTLVVAMELSGESWQLGVVIPGRVATSQARPEGRRHGRVKRHRNPVSLSGASFVNARSRNQLRRPSR